MTRPTPPALALLAAPLVLALAGPGCGSSDAVRVGGKLLKGGNPYTPPSGQRIGVTFYAVEAKDAAGKAVPAGEPYPAQFNPADGTFTVPGPDGRGIPRGKYRVAISRQKGRGTVEAPKRRGAKPFDRETDLFQNQFGPDTSPIVREIAAPSDLVVDLDSPGA